MDLSHLTRIVLSNGRCTSKISSSWKRVMLACCGDIEENPGPSKQLATTQERKAFTSASTSKLLGWIQANLGPTGFDTIAGIWSTFEIPPCTTHLVADLTDAWEEMFGSKIPRLPDAERNQTVNLKSTIYNWVNSKGAAVTHRIRENVPDFTRNENIEVRSKPRKRAHMVSQDEAVSILNDTTASSSSSSYRVCPSTSNCQAHLPSPWAVMTHLNSQHKDEMIDNNHAVLCKVEVC